MNNFNAFHVTDLFGKYVLEKPVLLLHIDDPFACLQLTHLSKKDGSFWEVKKSILDQISKKTDSQVMPYGTIWFPSNSPKQCQILLANLINNTHTVISSSPILLKKIDGYGIWNAVNDKYQSIGCYLSKVKPNILMINKNLISKYIGKVLKKNQIVQTNQFNLFGIHNLSPHITINKLKHLNSNYSLSGYIKSINNNQFISLNDGYLGLSKNNNNKILITYSSYGELLINNLAITEESLGNIKLKKPNGSKKQKWIPYFVDGENKLTFTNYRNSFLCIDSSTGLLITNNILDKSQYYVWQVDHIDEHTDILESADWEPQKENDIVFIVPENPWFKNRNKPFNKPEPKKIIHKINYSDPNIDKRHTGQKKESLTKDYFWFWIKLILILIIITLVLSIIYHYFLKKN